MTVKLHGASIRRILEAAAWAEKVDSANAKKKLADLFATKGGLNKFGGYMYWLSEFAKHLKSVEVLLSLDAEEKETANV